LKKKNKSKVPAIILAAAIFAVWEAAARIVNVEHILPGPIAILRKTWELRTTLLTHQLPSTMITVVLGWGLAIAVGVLLAILMDVSPRAEAALYPALIVTQTVPVMCITPLFVLWFGYTMGARLLSVVLSTFFSITLNTFEGFRGVDRQKMELMQTYGASRRQIFRTLKMPTALPLFMTSLKMTFPWAVIDAAVAEWLGATQGLGYFSKRMITKMDGPGCFAPIVVLTAVALLGMAVIKLIDRKFVSYRNEI
jgi:putative hydroxymethylpyrimidine transport system permease protein